MEKELEIMVLKTIKYNPALAEQQVIFEIKGGKMEEVFEATDENGTLEERKEAKIILSITEYAGYPKRSYAKTKQAKYIHEMPLSSNQYQINGQVIDVNENYALIDAGKQLVFSIQNGITRKKILKKGNYVKIEGRLNIEKKHEGGLKNDK